MQGFNNKSTSQWACIIDFQKEQNNILWASSKWSSVISILGFQQQPFPFTYLGMPLTSKSISLSNCNYLISDFNGILCLMEEQMSLIHGENSTWSMDLPWVVRVLYTKLHPFANHNPSHTVSCKRVHLGKPKKVCLDHDDSSKKWRRSRTSGLPKYPSDFDSGMRLLNLVGTRAMGVLDEEKLDLEGNNGWKTEHGKWHNDMEEEGFKHHVVNINSTIRHRCPKDGYTTSIWASVILVSQRFQC